MNLLFFLAQNITNNQHLEKLVKRCNTRACIFGMNVWFIAVHRFENIIDSYDLRIDIWVFQLYDYDIKWNSNIDQNNINV